MSKRKKNELREGVLIEGYAAEGRCIARIDGVVTFVENVIPGDVVDLMITSKKKKLWEARVQRILTPSTKRVEAVCQHFGSCGGCRWQDLSYANQAAYKQQQVSDALQRIGKVEVGEMRPIISAPDVYRYRNRLDFSFSSNRWLTPEEVASDQDFSSQGGLGFHVPRRWDKVIEVEECHLQPEPSNAIRNRVRELAMEHGMSYYDPRAHQGFLRNLTLRNTLSNEWMLILAVGEDRQEFIKLLLDDLIARFTQLVSVLYVINSKLNDTFTDLDMICYHGTDHLVAEMEGLRFKVGPKSFYQTNSKQAYNLYSVARELAATTGTEVLYDLYTGTGTIALFMAKTVKKVVGIDYVAPAIDDARINAQLNGVENATFIAGDMKDVFTLDLIAEHGRPDVVITDPPRAGMDEKVVDRLIELLPQRIVYVSCNPATQARDLMRLDAHYTVAVSQPVDMFPHTHHIENVVLLIRK